MLFDSALVGGKLLRRYKRFLADVRLDSGETVIAHTANTGAMTGCAQPGSRVWLSASSNPKRKCQYTWELVEVEGGTLVGINTLRANQLVTEQLNSADVPELYGYESIRREVAYGEERSRIDLLLEQHLRPPCYIEVKNVTLVEKGVAMFPDAISLRGQKHLRELMTVVADGDRAVLCFCIQRHDVHEFRPADHIDVHYGRLLREAHAWGVDVLALKAQPDVGGITLTERVPVMLKQS
jgi:sugar fermentation stimulation protein A